MKRVFGWIFRILCLAIIGAAAFTVFQCVRHMNDDHSYEAVMGHAPYTAEQAIAQAPEAAQPSEETQPQEQSQESEQQPEILLAADGTASAEAPTVTVTATFSGLTDALKGTLLWYLDGALVEETDDLELREGDAVTCDMEVDVENAQGDEAVVEAVLEYDGGTISGGTIFGVERSPQVEIRTEEITVTCIEDCSIYSDSAFEHDTGKIMEAGDTGLLLAYETGGALDALNLQFPDGTAGWVSARRNQVTTENCTTDQDYPQAQKESFVNAMGYESQTRYLVWVNLYTQRINVFQGAKGSWKLIQSFSCATGVNTTPTSTGVYSLNSLSGHWDLENGTYVDPVLTFNGGEAFTSQPKSSETDEVVNDTIGEPASGGGVWMLEEDIAWMSDNLTLDTAVIIY